MVASNTGDNSSRPGQFTKGDPRINRKGRPRSFDALRKLAQSLANEPATTKEGVPIVIDEHVATQAEMIMRAMMRDNPERFVEIAYGKVPQPIEVSGPDKGPISVKAFDYGASTAPLAPGSVANRDAPGAGEDRVDGPALGQDDDGG